MGRPILIADSNPARAERLAEVCAVRGFPTRVAAQGAEALERALAEPPAAVVAAADLPVIGAAKLAEILRANPRTRAASFLVVADCDEHAPDAWPCEVLSPDLDPEQMVGAIERALAQSAELDALERRSGGVQEARGRLEQIPLSDLLQLLSLNRRSGALELQRDGRGGPGARGWIHLHQGEVVQAMVGGVEGEKAFFRLLAWDEGSFLFRAESPQVIRRIATPTRALLMEGMRQLDEWKRQRDQLPPLDARVRLAVSGASFPHVVHPLTQEVLLLLELYSSVREVVDHCSYPDFQVLRTLQTLVERGVVELERELSLPPPRGRLFSELQARRLREWLGSSRTPLPRDAKLLLVSPQPETTREFLNLLARLPGAELAQALGRGDLARCEVASLGRLPVDQELGIELLHIPADPDFAPLWPIAAHRALGVLALLTPPVAESERKLAAVASALLAQPRSRLFHVLLVRKHSSEAAQEIRAHPELLERASLLVLPLDGGDEVEALLRKTLARILP